ncbi:cytochrome c oxidase accessory protein FixG [Lacibacter cauensis]|uniref:Cytochrome c oxidase accessory protein FixG n=1 Tax=Lacibacter cauensis TaxID=510947 RepID=A0A562SDB4_9BACT|nr:cytochrome c oxidase accessory protein CcoG [Lacibacter cauensis]TWI79301.1 cytochrome c oxidase accessory protein FixG [Lacibacter cauensis]
MNNEENIQQEQKKESFRDRIATVDAQGKRKWIFAQKPKGKFYNIRTYVSFFFFLIFVTLPFIHVNGRPLFMFNIPQAKFIIFGKVFWPQDFFIFGIIMITFIVFIVLFTAAFGRLFCGWVCPQTIFMEMLFRKLEYAIEGDAAKQKLMAAGPWTSEKIARKATKHIVFYLLAFIIANFFLAYIIGVKELWAMMHHPADNVGNIAALMVFSAVFYAVYAFFREQACTVVCPYGRLQGVLLDKNSMIVAYDYKRGEERKKINKSEERTAGDCIDCHQCVKVCPTGIDIRNGTQMECVGCTACIDACDHMMESVGFKKGLIRYASENGIANHEKLHYTRRMKMYTGLLIVLTGLLTTLLLSQKDVKATVMRTPGLLFQEKGTDSISNLYNIKIVNKTMNDIPLTVKLEDHNGTIQQVGNTIHVKKEGQGAGSFFIILPKEQIKQRKTVVHVSLYEGDKKITTVKTNFLGPISSTN